MWCCCTQEMRRQQLKQQQQIRQQLQQGQTGAHQLHVASGQKPVLTSQLVTAIGQVSAEVIASLHMFDLLWNQFLCTFEAAVEALRSGTSIETLKSQWKAKKERKKKKWKNGILTSNMVVENWDINVCSCYSLIRVAKQDGCWKWISLCVFMPFSKWCD